MPTYRLDLSYDGQGFHGYARQRDVRTVQGDLEAALARILEPIKTEVAGRTDAGVHARHQVASFSTEMAVDCHRLARSLNGLLSPEIVVFNCRRVVDGFSARFNATRRIYRYHILNRPLPDPLRRTTMWHVKDPLDVAAMDRMVGYLVGEHDFASFCRKAEGRSTVRAILSAGWTCHPEDLVRLEIAGTAFCHQMVRSIAALSVEIGRGKMAPESVLRVIEARNRNAARGAAPPHGLVLWKVEYEPNPSGA